MKKAKKILEISFIAMIITCVCLITSGCGSFWEDRIERLESIPKDNRFAIVVNNTYVKYGNLLIGFSDTVTPAIEQLLNMDIIYEESQFKVFENKCFFATTYYVDEERTKTSGVIGVATLPYLDDIQVLYEVPECELDNHDMFSITCKSYNNYLIYQYNDNVIGVNCETLKVTETFGGDYKSVDSKSIAYVLYSKTDDTTTFRVYDEELEEYTFTVLGEHNGRYAVTVYDNYAFFYLDFGGLKCVDIHTGNLVDNAQELYKEYTVSEMSGNVIQLSDGNYYLGIKSPDPEENESSHRYENIEIIFTNVETDEKITFTMENLIENSPDLEEIIGIFPSIKYSSYWACDGEIVFCFKNDHNFFAGRTTESAPNILFKCDVKNQTFTYINYVERPDHNITRVIKI